MTNYQQAKIYKMVCNVSGKVYYGSTVQSLAKRKGQHKEHLIKYKKGEQTYISSIEVMENNNYSIVLVENYPCNSKEELYSRERFYIENNKCVNNVLPIRTKKEYYETYKELINNKRKKDYQENKEKYKQKSKEWSINNKEKIYEYNKKSWAENKEERQQKHKEWYKENKDKVIEKDKIYKEKNKTKLEEKFDCECGGTYKFKCKSTHFKTKLHLNYLSSLK